MTTSVERERRREDTTLLKVWQGPGEVVMRGSTVAWQGVGQEGLNTGKEIGAHTRGQPGLGPRALGRM